MAGLARALRLRDALAAIEGVQRRGVPPGDEVSFGVVVNSPLAPGAPLAVVQPHEGEQAQPALIQSSQSGGWMHQGMACAWQWGIREHAGGGGRAVFR